MEESQVLFTLLGHPVTQYAACVVAAVAVGLLLFGWGQKKNGLRADTAEIFGLLALPLGLLGGRAFYCLSRLQVYMEMGLENVLRMWNGGYALWGVVGGCILAAALTAKITRQPVKKLLDALTVPGLLTLALCRFAEPACGEGIGMEVGLSAFQRFPFALYNADWDVWFWAICLLEGAVALIIAAVLLDRKRFTVPGSRAKMAAILYCSAQILLESLRRDNFLRWLFVRVSQLTAVLVLGGLMFYALYRWTKTPAEKRMPTRKLAVNWGIFLACVVVCIAMEFAVDKSASLPVWLCYAVMAVCCVIMGVTSAMLIMKGVQPDENA